MWLVFLKSRVSQNTHTNLIKTRLYRRYAKKNKRFASSLHWFHLKSKSFPIVYVGANFHSGHCISIPCSAKTIFQTYTNMCKNKPKKTTCFLDFRAFAGVCKCFAYFCGICAGRFGRVCVFVFAQILHESFTSRIDRVVE